LHYIQEVAAGFPGESYNKFKRIGIDLLGPKREFQKVNKGIAFIQSISLINFNMIGRCPKVLEKKES